MIVCAEVYWFFCKMTTWLLFIGWHKTLLFRRLRTEVKLYFFITYLCVTHVCKDLSFGKYRTPALYILHEPLLCWSPFAVTCFVLTSICCVQKAFDSLEEFPSHTVNCLWEVSALSFNLWVTSVFYQLCVFLQWICVYGRILEPWKFFFFFGSTLYFDTTKKIAISNGQSSSQQHRKPSQISIANNIRPSTAIRKSLVDN